jgi:hypothetical protein
MHKYEVRQGQEDAENRSSSPVKTEMLNKLRNEGSMLGEKIEHLNPVQEKALELALNKADLTWNAFTVVDSDESEALKALLDNLESADSDADIKRIAGQIADQLTV